MKTVLIIDDNKYIRNLLIAILETYNPNINILEAADGEAGLQKAAHYMPELIFVDGRLPKLCGNDVARQLRANPATSAARIIGFTGESPNSQIVKEMKEHCSVLLFKPCKSAQIAQACSAQY